MADFDPDFRHETWLFLRRPDARPGPNRKKRLERLRFNVVYYDDSPDGWIEPAPPSDFYSNLFGDDVNVSRQSRADGTGRATRFEFYDIVPFDGVHGFD